MVKGRRLSSDKDPVHDASGANHGDSGRRRSWAHGNDLQAINGRGRVFLKYGIHVDVIAYKDAGHDTPTDHLSGDTVHQAVERGAKDGGRSLAEGSRGI